MRHPDARYVDGKMSFRVELELGSHDKTGNRAESGSRKDCRTVLGEGAGRGEILSMPLRQDRRVPKSEPEEENPGFVNSNCIQMGRDDF